MVCLDWKTVILAPIEKCNTVESNNLDFHPRRPGTAGAENITKLGSLIFKIMCVAFSCALRIECNSQMWNWAIYEKMFPFVMNCVNHADSHHGRTPQAILAGGCPTLMICAFMIQPNPIIHIYNAWPADCCLCYQSGPASNHDLLLLVSSGFFWWAVLLVHPLAQIHFLPNIFGNSCETVRLRVHIDQQPCDVLRCSFPFASSRDFRQAFGRNRDISKVKTVERSFEHQR